MNKQLIQIICALTFVHLTCAQYESSYFSRDTRYTSYLKLKGNVLSAVNLDGTLLDDTSFETDDEFGSKVYGFVVDPKSTVYPSRFYQAESLRTLSPGFELGFSFIPDSSATNNLGLGVYYFSEGGIPIVISYPFTGHHSNANVFYKASGFGYNVIRRFDRWLFSAGAVVGSSREYAPGDVYPMVDVMSFAQMPSLFDPVSGHSTSTSIPVYGTNFSVEHSTFEMDDYMVALGAYFKYFMPANKELYLPLHGSTYINSSDPSQICGKCTNYDPSSTSTPLPAQAPVSNIDFSRYYVFGFSVNISRFL